MADKVITTYDAATSISSTDTIVALISGATKLIAALPFGKTVAAWFGVHLVTGLVGNNTTAAAANLTAINTALESGGVCIIPPGANYYVNGSLVVPSNTILYARGGSITLGAASNVPMLVNSDSDNGNTDIKVIGGVWNPDHAHQTEQGDINDHGMRFINVNGLEVVNTNTVNGPFRFAIAVFGCSNAWVHDNRASSLLRDFIHVTGMSCSLGGTAVNRNIVVERNHVAGFGDDPYTCGIGDAPADYQPGTKASIEGLVIRDNTATGGTLGSIKLFISRADNDTNMYYFRNVQITGNTIATATAGVVINADSISGHSEANVIEGCIVRDNNIYAGNGWSQVSIGWWGDTSNITVDGLNINSTGSNAVKLTALHISAKSRIDVSRLRGVAGVTPASVQVIADSGTVFDQITINDVNYSGVTTSYMCQINAITANRVAFRDIFVEGSRLFWYDPKIAAGTATHTQSCFFTASNIYAKGASDWVMRLDSLGLLMLNGITFDDCDETVALFNGPTVTVTGGGAINFLNTTKYRPSINSGVLIVNHPEFTVLVPNDVAAPRAMDVCISTGGSITGRAICTSATGPVWAKWGWS